jgi:hypothetical protein
MAKTISQLIETAQAARVQTANTGPSYTEIRCPVVRAWFMWRACRERFLSQVPVFFTTATAADKTTQSERVRRKEKGPTHRRASCSHSALKATRPFRRLLSSLNCVGSELANDFDTISQSGRTESAIWYVRASVKEHRVALADDLAQRFILAVHAGYSMVVRDWESGTIVPDSLGHPALILPLPQNGLHVLANDLQVPGPRVAEVGSDDEHLAGEA